MATFVGHSPLLGGPVAAGPAVDPFPVGAAVVDRDLQCFKVHGPSLWLGQGILPRLNSGCGGCAGLSAPSGTQEGQRAAEDRVRPGTRICNRGEV